MNVDDSVGLEKTKFIKILNDILSELLGKI